MANNVKYANNTRHISIKVHFVRNFGRFKLYKIYWCEGDIKLADSATNNVGENYLNPRMKYIMVRFEK